MPASQKQTITVICVSNGACAHYVMPLMVSKFQWKPFWLATQRDPQNDWAATQNRVNYDAFAQAPLHKNCDDRTLNSQWFSVAPFAHKGRWRNFHVFGALSLGLNFNIFWNFFCPFFCYAVSSCVYDHSHPYLVSECLFLAENKAFPYPRRVRAHPRRLRAILWDAAATCSVVIFVVVAEKKRSRNLSVSWLTLYGLVDRLPVSAGNFRRALQRHFLVDFQTKDIAGKIFSCSKRAYFALVNRARNGWTAFARSLPTHRSHDWSNTALWGRSAASEPLQRHLSIDFQNQGIIGKIFSCSKRACFAFVNRTRNGWTAPARS